MLGRTRLQWGRRRLAAKAEHPALKRYLAAPLPGARSLWRDVRFVALDIETTGVDVASAEMLSIGWVPIENGAIQLAGANTQLICPEGDVGQSATIHGLTDTRVSEGTTVEKAFLRLLEALESSIVIVHHAVLDIGMLNRASRDVFGTSLPLPVIDTLALQKQKLLRESGGIAADALRLASVRDAYSLPVYAAHECLGDAIATAEVFLAMVHHRFGGHKARLRDVWG